ncbi:hypothetical protein SHM7688_02518 [Shimia marina]|uniref:Uncharacterized protein n=1 Tax=Shimia marina TaxID=321267 RepID=A0A0P1ERR0_9RHOB|nr:hypothetical protein SHM7688_02518 [Shimia marina]
MEDFGAHADGFANVRCAHRHDHEFLDVDRVVGMLAAVDDVHHWHRQNARGGAAHIAEQRLRGVICGGFGSGEGHAEDGICTQTAFVFCAVQFDHGAVNGDLLGHIHAHERFGDFAIHGVDSLKHTFAQVAGCVAIALFNGFMRAGGGARRHSGTAHGAVFEDHVDFNSWIAAAVEDFAGENVNDCAHLGGVPDMTK